MGFDLVADSSATVAEIAEAEAAEALAGFIRQVDSDALCLLQIGDNRVDQRIEDTGRDVGSDKVEDNDVFSYSVEDLGAVKDDLEVMFNLGSDSFADVVEPG